MTKTFLTAAVLALLPGLALAMGCSERHLDQTAMSCAAGSVYDAETGSCKVVSG